MRWFGAYPPQSERRWADGGFAWSGVGRDCPSGERGHCLRLSALHLLCLCACLVHFTVVLVGGRHLWPCSVRRRGRGAERKRERVKLSVKLPKSYQKIANISRVDVVLVLPQSRIHVCTPIPRKAAFGPARAGPLRGASVDLDRTLRTTVSPCADPRKPLHMSYVCQNTWISSRTQNTRKLWCLNPERTRSGASPHLVNAPTGTLERSTWICSSSAWA